MTCTQICAGVDRVLSTHNNKKLVVSGSADNDTIHNALKHVQKHHHHFTPGQRFHNPFRGLIHNHLRSQYTPSWNQQQAHTSADNNNITPYESDGKYGPDYGQAPQHHYRPGSLRHLLFDSWRSSDHSNSGYTYYDWYYDPIIIQWCCAKGSIWVFFVHWRFNLYICMEIHEGLLLELRMAIKWENWSATNSIIDWSATSLEVWLQLQIRCSTWTIHILFKR